MSMLEGYPGLLEALRGEMTPKFLATRNVQGVPNVVPCISLMPCDDQPDNLFFGNFLLRKSIKNLEADPRLTILVITTELTGWILKGEFIEFQHSGKYYDLQMNSNLLRYNAYTGIRNAGLVRVISIEHEFSVTRLQVLRDFIRARLAARQISNGDHHGVMIPDPVKKEFARMVAVKVLAWVAEDNYPMVIPALSLQPASETSMVGWLSDDRLAQPVEGSPVAANILTFEAISYQAKGLWSCHGRAGAIRVEQIYAGGPPYPGGQVA